MSMSGQTNTQFEFHCPHDGTVVAWEITPERVNTPPLVDANGVHCPTCYRDISPELWQALNAPAFLAHHVLEHGGISRSGRSGLTGAPVGLSLIHI